MYQSETLLGVLERIERLGWVIEKLVTISIFYRW
jgi:hypothetical protein